MTLHHTLYQIFYGTNKFDKPGDIQKCFPYMLTKEYAAKMAISAVAAPSTVSEPVSTEEHVSVSEPASMTVSEPASMTVSEPASMTVSEPASMPVSEPSAVTSVVVTNTQRHASNKDSIYYPKHTNSLFWCVYIGAYGMGEYMMNERKSANVEMQERQKMLDYFRDTKNTGKLKQGNTKVSNVLIQEIMADIMVANRDPNSAFHMLIALSVFHKKTIYFVRKNKYVVFSYTENTEDLDIENTLIIYAKNDRECGLCEDPTAEKIRDIIQNKYRLVSYDKPLRGISTYKIPDLEEIARKLCVDVCNEQGGALKKAELYNKIAAQALL